jgi:hypothetical protein
VQAATAIAAVADAGAGEGPACGTFDALMGEIRGVFAGFHDRRTGRNTRYTMLDAGLGAFAVFFTQSPSFLAHQSAMQKARGQSNAQTLFLMDKVPTDAHIRTLLDPVPPESVFPAYDAVLGAMEEAGSLAVFRGYRNSRLVALDGTKTYHSGKIHCKNCTVTEHSNGQTGYRHSALTPVLVAPGDPRAVPLRPEFVVPQDGHDKQDCEIAASKRWLDRNADRYLLDYAPTTYLGDDLYAHDPFCRKVLARGEHFIFTCLPASHKTLYAWVGLLEDGKDVRTVEKRVLNKDKHWETHTARHASNIPLTDAEDALRVNWLELVVRDKDGNETFRNAWITDWTLTDGNAHAVAESGRARWGIENGNNNTLKTKGYHLEHNFGHGKDNLSNVLVALNILAFLLHTHLDAADGAYRMVRAALPTRKTFFEHLRALTTYICFPSWPALLDFMMRGLEIGPYEPPPKPEKRRRRARKPR